MFKQLFIILILLSSFITNANAQTSRRALEKYSTEAIKQIAMSGRTPTVDILDSLANNAEISIEMISRMDDPDDMRQTRACMKLIDAVVDFSLTETGRKYVDVVRSGLKKALDRSYEPDMQLHVMEQLARCAKPADASHIAMYLEVPELAATAHNILVSMNGIDDNIAKAAAEQPGIKQKVKNIIDIHAGKATVPAVAAVAATEKAKAPALPFWTESLNRAVEQTAEKSTDATADIIINNKPAKAVQLLTALAQKSTEGERDAIIARCLSLIDGSGMNGAERYLLLRDIDNVTTADNTLHQRTIVSLGETETVQALAYLRQYMSKPDMADALAVATTDIIGAHPEANGGRTVNSLLYASKQSFIRHYDEQGVDTRIDNVLAAIDNWRADNGYNFAHTEETRMEKRGFWIVHDEMADFKLTFDWKADGVLTVYLRSMPVLALSNNQGARLAGDDTWHKFDNSASEWATAEISVKGDKVTVTINGQKLIDGARLLNNEAGEPANKTGYIKFLADDNGATIRNYCFTRQ